MLTFYQELTSKECAILYVSVNIIQLIFSTLNSQNDHFYFYQIVLYIPKSCDICFVLI